MQTRQEINMIIINYLNPLFPNTMSISTQYQAYKGQCLNSFSGWHILTALRTDNPSNAIYILILTLFLHFYLDLKRKFLDFFLTDGQPEWLSFCICICSFTNV